MYAKRIRGRGGFTQTKSTGEGGTGWRTTGRGGEDSSGAAAAARVIKLAVHRELGFGGLFTRTLDGSFSFGPSRTTTSIYCAFGPLTRRSRI